MRRHIPILYPHPEGNDDVDENDRDDQWSAPGHVQLPYGTPPGMSSLKTRTKQRSPTTFTASPGNALITPPIQPPPPSSSSKYSDIYAQFVKRYRSRPATFDDPRDDPEATVFHRGGQIFEDESDEELPRSLPSYDNRDRHVSPLDTVNVDHLTIEQRERLEWQSMLASVLDGDVLKSEKSRIQVALQKSADAGNNRHLDVWIGIRAKLRGRSVQEERRILEERKLHLVDRVIGEIMQFRVQGGPGFPSAFHQVNVVLQHLDKIQSFYPNLKVFYLDKPAAAQPDFQARCDTLITWTSVLVSLRQQLAIFRKWTGSETLDVTAPSAEHEGTSFVERVLKEETIQRTFEKGSLTTVHALIASARDTQVNLAPMFQLLNLPTFEEELVQLISFPTRLAHALLRSRLDYARRVTDPDVLIIDQMLDDFRLAIGLACTLKRQYEAFLLPDPGGNWNLPSCITQEYDETLLETLKMFFKFIHWKLKSGTKDIYFRETEVLEAQWATFNDVSMVVEGGTTLVAEQICSITNKLMTRATNNFERQIRVPVHGREKQKGYTSVSQVANSPSSMNGLGFDFQRSMAESKGKLMTGEQMISWYEKVLESVKARYRKLQRFSRALVQRFGNAAEYSLEHSPIDPFIATLVESDHFLVYTQSFEEDGTYVIASSGLRDQPDLIRQLLRDPFHVRNLWEDGYATVPRTADTTQPPANSDAESNEETVVEKSAYLLILSPRMRFLWNGLVLMLPLSQMAFDMKDNRVRLIADGPHARLSLAKEKFEELFASTNEEDESTESYCPPCVIDQMAHLPAVHRELKKITKGTNNLAEAIVSAVHYIRNTVPNVPGRADLLESWFAFASEHGQHAQKYMDNAYWMKFNRLLIKLAISWVSFICDDCDPTDRKTFRWAVTALEFVLLRTKRNNILRLPEDQFEMLRQRVASCMTLLISHFDILGARSAQDAVKEKERQEELRQLALDGNNPGRNDEDFWEPITPASGPEYEAQSFARMVTSGERSIRRYRDEVVRNLRLLDEKRANVGSEQNVVGRVLDDQKPEDQSLMFLASATSNVSIRWQQGKFIGAGAFGSVYTAINLDTGSVMAVKEIRVQDVTGTPNLYRQIQDELRVMEMLHHPNIVEFYGIEVHRDKVYIFEEYCEGGSLAANLEIGRIADENILQIYTMQMLEGLSYLHSRNIVHRDIKPDNILLDHMGVLKFVDFGAAKVIAKNTRTVQRTRLGSTTMNASATAGLDSGLGVKNSLTGTPMYMSPEVIKNDKRGRHGAMDIWSMGCVVLECATGRKPWSNLDNEWAIMFHIGVATQHPPLPENGELSELGINFIKQCLTIDPMRRPTAEELMHHPWMVQLLETLRNYEEEELATNAPVEMPSEQEFQGAAVARHAAIEKEKEVEAIKAASPDSITPISESSAADAGLSASPTPPLMTTPPSAS
ncbi:SSK2 [Sanghuangporus sanghuang]